MAKKISKGRKNPHPGGAHNTHGSARTGKKQGRPAHGNAWERAAAPAEKPQAKTHVRSGSRGGKVREKNAGPAARKPQGKTVACTMARVSGTYGFAQPIGAVGREEDIFIPGRYLCGALPGDEVQVMLSPNPRREGTREGEVTAVTAGEGSVTGVLEHDGWRLWLRPDFCTKMTLAVNDDDPALAGQKAACVPVVRGRDYDEHLFAIELCFGDAESAAACCAAVLHENGIRTEFPDKVLTAAHLLQTAAGGLSVTQPGYSAVHFPPQEVEGRLDLREEAIFTIDSASTKDIDDAINVSALADGWQLGVHIADVSHYVRPYSALDKEALARGTSVYYADQVVPMLPKELSNDLCSLNEDVDRLAFSCIMRLDTEANVTDFRFAKSVIRSRVKGVYSEINAILAGDAAPELCEKYREVADQLPMLHAIYEKLAAKRDARGGMDIESEESKLLTDENGVCIGVEKRERGVSERIIEECMVLTNGCAARFAREQQLPFVYRIHDKPEAERVENLKKVLGALGVDYHFAKETPAQTELAALLDATRATPLEPAVHNAILRTQAKAVYSPEPVGHYSLALADYAHFTSPIRRYPDLAIHRILSTYLENGAENCRRRFADFAPRAADAASERELAATAAERACDDCYKAEYMRTQLGNTAEGVITAVTEFGVYVMLDNTVEGMIRAEALCAAPELQEGVALRDALTGRRWAVGDRMRVQVAAVNVPLGQIDFMPVEEK